MKKTLDNTPEENTQPHTQLLAKLPLELLAQLESVTTHDISVIKKAQKYSSHQIKADTAKIEQLLNTITILDRYMKEGIPKNADPSAPNLENKILYDEYVKAVNQHELIKQRLHSAIQNSAYDEHSLFELSQLKSAIVQAKEQAKPSTGQFPAEVPIDTMFIFIEAAMRSVTKTTLRLESDLAIEPHSQDISIQHQVLSDEKFQDYLYDTQNSVIEPFVLLSRKLYAKSLECLQDTVLKLEQEACFMKQYVQENRNQMSDSLYAATYKYQVELQVRIDILKNTKEIIINQTSTAMKSEKIQRRDSLRGQKNLDPNSLSSSPTVQHLKKIGRRLSGIFPSRSSSESSSPSNSTNSSPVVVRKQDPPVISGLKQTAKALTDREEAKEKLSQSNPEASATLNTPPGSPKGGQG